MNQPCHVRLSFPRGLDDNPGRLFAGLFAALFGRFFVRLFRRSFAHLFERPFAHLFTGLFSGLFKSLSARLFVGLFGDLLARPCGTKTPESFTRRLTELKVSWTGKPLVVHRTQSRKVSKPLNQPRFAKHLRKQKGSFQIHRYSTSSCQSAQEHHPHYHHRHHISPCHHHVPNHPTPPRQNPPPRYRVR